MAEMTVIEALRSGLDEAMDADERVFIFGEDVGRRGGVFRATEGLLDKYGPYRVIDSPLSEAIIAGASIGAAMYGLRPVAEIQFADFIWPAANQIISEAARMRYRSNNGWGVPMVIRAPYGGGIHGALYHSQSVESFFAHVPGLKIVAPATPYDIKGLIKSAIADPDPVLFFEHKKTYRLIKGEIPDQDYVVPIGVADVKRPGDAISVITYGMVLHYALEAAAQLADLLRVRRAEERAAPARDDLLRAVVRLVPPVVVQVAREEQAHALAEHVVLQEGQVALVVLLAVLLEDLRLEPVRLGRAEDDAVFVLHPAGHALEELDL